MTIKSVKDMVTEANSMVEVLSADEALKAQTAGSGKLVDIRDIRELQREGAVDGAVHAPRGMLEFWFDPASPYHREVFDDADKKFILFCAAGWRSALAAKTLKDMGFENIAHVDGGFAALNDAGATINREEKK